MRPALCAGGCGLFCGLVSRCGCLLDRFGTGQFSLTLCFSGRGLLLLRNVLRRSSRVNASTNFCALDCASWTAADNVTDCCTDDGSRYLLNSSCHYNLTNIK